MHYSVIDQVFNLAESFGSLATSEAQPSQPSSVFLPLWQRP
jgi:hypothetical protein